MAQTERLGAVLRGDRDAALDPHDWPLALVSAAFAGAVARRFAGRFDRRMTTRFATRMVRHAPGADRFLVRHVDTVLRMATGDAHLYGAVVADESTAEDHLRIPYATLLALVDDLELDDDQVRALLAEAGAAAGAAGERGPMDLSELDLGGFRRTHRRYLADRDWLPARPAVLRAPRGPGAVRRTGRPESRAGRYVHEFLLARGPGGLGPDDVPYPDLLRVMRSAFALAIDRHLHPDADVREIDQLVVAAQGIHPELDFMKTEYLARTGLGERVPMDGITGADVYGACSLMLAAIAARWDFHDAALTSVVLEAEESVGRSGYRLRR